MSALREMMRIIETEGYRRLETVTRDPYTMVSIDWGGYDGFERITGVGFAKRNPRDERDVDMGFNIAYGRALKEIAVTVLRIRATRNIQQARELVHVMRGQIEEGGP